MTKLIVFSPAMLALILIVMKKLLPGFQHIACIVCDDDGYHDDEDYDDYVDEYDDE